ncbi:phosphoethanolamine--lipid A transferase [Massilia sp. SR12]
MHVVTLLKSLRIRAYFLPFIAAAVLVAVFNVPFWERFVLATGGEQIGKLPLLACTFLMLTLAFGAALSVLNAPRIMKPVLVLLFMMSAVVSYFMNEYGIQIDKSMVQNVVETDPGEAWELLNWRMLVTVALFGVLPSALLARTQIQYDAPARHIATTALVIAAATALALVILFVFFKSYAPAVRGHRELRFLLTPTNYIQAVNGYVRQRLSKPSVIAPLGRDASKGPVWREGKQRAITVIVVGETARAMNFSLNGYPRITNPLLSQRRDLINFTDVASCGTATAVSLPCLFSVMDREDFNDSRARSQEGLLDVLKHAGLDVVWRNNNSGCKGACDRVTYQDLSKPSGDSKYCTNDECYDERLLEDLPELVRSTKKDMVIVLHQKGSHGPAYWKRYPPDFEQFAPVCKTNALEQCTREQIAATYDNTILYTDYFLDKTISLLERIAREDGAATSMLYVSDHGESLGEKNMYLHGAPYLISPPEQRKVPMLMWFSSDFEKRFKVSRTCLSLRAKQPLSHDNVFHSVLGMLHISTVARNPRLDIFNACRS